MVRDEPMMGVLSLATRALVRRQLLHEPLSQRMRDALSIQVVVEQQAS